MVCLDINVAHGITISDVDMKQLLRICAIPQEVYVKFNTTADKKSHCSNEPHRGNQYSSNLHVCTQCAKELSIRFHLEPAVINSFSSYYKKKKYLLKLHDRLQAAKTEEMKQKLRDLIGTVKMQINEAWSSETQKKWNEIRNQILGSGMRKSKRKLNKTKANINEQIQFLNDEENLQQLEKILKESCNPNVLAGLTLYFLL